MNLDNTLSELNLKWIQANLADELSEAARKKRSHEEFFTRLLTGEKESRDALNVERRIREAKLPARKTMENFDWAWPEVINRDQVRHLFSLRFIEEKSNVTLIAGPGLGKSHIALALALAACQRQYRVLFTSAAEIVNTLTQAMAATRLGSAIKRYTSPSLLCCDELGYAPVDRLGADLLFQVFSGRYERGATIITTNRPYKSWAKTFANDSTLASAVVDRVIHHCETVVIKGVSYRLKGRINLDELGELEKQGDKETD